MTWRGYTLKICTSHPCRQHMPLLPLKCPLGFGTVLTVCAITEHVLKRWFTQMTKIH